MDLSFDFKKRLGSFDLHAALDYDINGILGILARSGSGKSVTLKCIAGLIKPDSGYIRLDGETLFDSFNRTDLPPQKRRIGYMFQSFALFPDMTVEENIKAGMHDLDAGKKQSLSSDLISIMGLESVTRQLPSQLSNGQKQRTALARMIGNRPRIALLDEPFSSIDQYLKEKLIYEVKQVLEHYGINAVLISHDRDEIYKMCSDTAIIADGRILTAKPTQDMFMDPGYLEASILTGCKNNLSCVRESDFSVSIPSIDTVFITDKHVDQDISYVGIRAHSFDPNCESNRFRIRVTGELSDTFERIITFRYENQKDAEPDLWWKVPKGSVLNEYPECLGIPGNRIMLLKK